MDETNPCPCGSDLAFSACCEPVLRGEWQAPTAEALLRARYAAFTRGDVDFIMVTHHSRTRHQVKRRDIESWSKGSEWLGLEILEVEGGSADDLKGTVVFQARYRADGKVQEHREKSVFQRENGQWRFFDGQSVKHAPIRRETPKVGRNDPCPCGSGRKYKKCCGSGAAPAEDG